MSEAQEYFRRYCSRQAIITGNPAAGLSHSPSLKAGAKGDPARPSSAASSANKLATGKWSSVGGPTGPGAGPAGWVEPQLCSRHACGA